MTETAASAKLPRQRQRTTMTPVSEAEGILHVGGTVKAKCQNTMFYDKDGVEYDQQVDEALLVKTEKVVSIFKNGDATNNTHAAEFFSYRPHFVLNGPARMKGPVMRYGYNFG
ncbi:MAG TPA: hypothetical protein VFI68_14530 [Anaerolineales bacterium]|nr:hypothetical protein [Anaerolineales bacterium]